MLLGTILQFDWVNQASQWTIEIALPAERAFFHELLPTGNSLVKNARWWRHLTGSPIVHTLVKG